MDAFIYLHQALLWVLIVDRAQYNQIHLLGFGLKTWNVIGWILLWPKQHTLAAQTALPILDAQALKIFLHTMEALMDIIL